jgi:hypothetical protein
MWQLTSGPGTLVHSSAQPFDLGLDQSMGDAYVEWRVASDIVRQTYRDWTTARSADVAAAFAAHRAALDGENLAAAIYADIVIRTRRHPVA